MFKVALIALASLPLTFAAANAFDNDGANRAANAFSEFGLQGLGVAGQASLNDGAGPSYVMPSYAPSCWTQYVTVANGNTLMNAPYTICR